MRLTDPVQAMSGLNKKQKEALEAIGLRTVRDLIFHFPFRYEDYSVRVPLSRLTAGMDVTIVAKVEWLASRNAFRRRRLSLTEAVLSDGTGQVTAIWFNQPYLSKYVQAGKTYRFAGKVVQTKYGLRLQSPVYGHEEAGQETPTDGPVSPFLPVYPSTVGLSQFALRKLVRRCLVTVGQMTDHLPEKLLDDCGLMALTDALRSVHFPEIPDEQAAARRRLAFDELLRLQLVMGRTRRYRQARQALSVPFDQAAVTRFVDSLPFKLTDDQRRAGWEAIRDLEKETPMSRLLDGDVGSGKTAVAALVAANVAAAGHQTALMAPTEILALQHYRTLKQMFAEGGPGLALLTGSYRRRFQEGEETDCKSAASRRELLAAIAAGEISVVVGTQALVEPTVAFGSLALAMVDEQHRFGVRVRQGLCGKGGDGLEPHLLSMTATPIPRSLALAVYGDLDLSVLKEKPGGRQPIMTKVVWPRSRATAYKSIRKELDAGRQAFFVCPLIDASDMLGVTSATEERQRLTEEVFPDLEIGLLHGRMSAAEKEEIMGRFKSGEVKVLVATSVIEVGVDVPNATVMCIEGAERFGLAQLHQFRGRVGRGEHQSYCYLFPSAGGAAAKERLAALEATDDGFVLAEKDLALRGPGDLLGVEQSGQLSELKLATVADLELIRMAREATERLLADDPELERSAVLREFVGEPLQTAHLE
ncbi:MAG: ATP-dependent DNA helicase RecG [bacterium]